MHDPKEITEFISRLITDPSISPWITCHEYIPQLEPSFSDLEIREELKRALEKRGITRLYSHQTEAVKLIRQGRNTVVMTPTASGKSLIYNIPVIEEILANPDARALYIFPLKGLEQDQVKNFNSLVRDCLGENKEPSAGKGRRKSLEHAEVYDGDTTPYRRKKIREQIPNLIFTNPDMLHLALNPFHTKWEEFFRNLQYVIIDEVHTYRGIFGSHVSHVLRRLRRICSKWGSNPRFIACSATIANPKELSETLTGLPFELVDASGAPRSGRHFLFLNTMDSAYTEATRIFIKSINAGLRTILFTKARKVTELIYRWTVERAPLLADKISPYRAGFLPAERREIEERLFSGELMGVISTSALELGVDIGGLDVCILCGYPGSVSSTWQRAGRVGRQGQESLIVMIPLKDSLDQYLATHPQTFFGKPHEASVCDPWNRKILKSHIPCAASEVYLRFDDPVYPALEISDLIEELEREGRLRRWKKGDLWFSGIPAPQREVGIRSIGRPLKLRDEQGRQIGDLDGRRIYRDGFPGAIYLHRGRQYQVYHLDLGENEALCREVNLSYYTQALSNEVVEIMDMTKAPLPVRGVELYSGRLRITYQVVGYDRKNIYNGTKISRHSVEMPEYVFETEGIWIIIPKALSRKITAEGFDLPGTLHAAEHVTISCIPLFSLSDKGDIGGYSYPLYPDFETPAIFIYDGYEGGMGIVKRVLEGEAIFRDWIAASMELIKGCPCETGCPSCVQ
ncbi:MAG: DEAD/DEAH box helicase, partial [Nitrospirales bacterium]|nr:DEAD/DEAH box helicase [Nitrospirales bacterium]